MLTALLVNYKLISLCILLLICFATIVLFFVKLFGLI